MQSKISTFFRGSSSSSSSSSSSAAFDALPKSPEQTSISEDGDELDAWEKKQHRFRETYTRRFGYCNSIENENAMDSELVKKTESEDDIPMPTAPRVSGTTVVRNKKRNYAQFHLEFGQSDFVLHACTTCGIKYVAGDEKDEKIHKSFHKEYTHGIQFKGWSNERVVRLPGIEDGRIVIVSESDSRAHINKVKEVVKMMETELGSGWIFNKLCKAFLFISSQRVVGCAVAEPIEKAFRVVSVSENINSDRSTRDKRARSATTLQYGAISFRREVVRRPLEDVHTRNSEEDFKATIFCEKEAVPAICGIRAIWVSPANRRKHIATKLLDSARKSFCLESVMERSQMAFSQPTLAGKALASNYIGGGSFLVYKSTNLTSDD